MCGIVGYIGSQQAVPILIDGLKRLEYRGYDSAGMAILEDGKLHFEKAAGKISVLANQIKDKTFESNTGIAHTRWATHGIPNDINAHPHLDGRGRIAVVHNGIIENFRGLRGFLEKRGHTFKSDTDTEIISHLIEEYYTGDLAEAVRTAMSQVTGTYGIAVVNLDEPDVLVAARHGSPLVVGQGEGENFLASDVSAILGHTKQVVYLEDRELAKITRDNVEISTIDNIPVTRDSQEISWSLDMIEKEGYPH
ncbi:MAG: glutamine--fructose-6-phosphate aminotransferase, partial [candidate division Zixibacteria bacterium]|nr:glutamine--fructose-6-phosphate aminotransferase [candidate division Zixibacteria bacterium]